MGRYATRGADDDRMLRAGLLIDLHSVVKHALRKEKSCHVRTKRAVGDPID
jgi:hypothetical protein